MPKWRGREWADPRFLRQRSNRGKGEWGEEGFENGDDHGRERGWEQAERKRDLEEIRGAEDPERGASGGEVERQDPDNYTGDLEETGREGQELPGHDPDKILVLD